MRIRNVVTGSLGASAVIIIAAIIGAAIGVAAGSMVVWAVNAL